MYLCVQADANVCSSCGPRRAARTDFRSSSHRRGCAAAAERGAGPLADRDTDGLGAIDIQIADLGSAALGYAGGNTITLDDNAAGWGWFIDVTPADDNEFT